MTGDCCRAARPDGRAPGNWHSPDATANPMMPRGGRRVQPDPRPPHSGAGPVRNNRIGRPIAERPRASAVEDTNPGGGRRRTPAVEDDEPRRWKTTDPAVEDREPRRWKSAPRDAHGPERGRSAPSVAKSRGPPARGPAQRPPRTPAAGVSRRRGGPRAGVAISVTGRSNGSRGSESTDLVVEDDRDQSGNARSGSRSGQQGEAAVEVAAAAAQSGARPIHRQRRDQDDLGGS